MSAILPGLMFRRAEQTLHVSLSFCLSCSVKTRSTHFQMSTYSFELSSAGGCRWWDASSLSNHSFIWDLTESSCTPALTGIQGHRVEYEIRALHWFYQIQNHLIQIFLLFDAACLEKEVYYTSAFYLSCKDFFALLMVDHFSAPTPTFKFVLPENAFVKCCLHITCIWVQTAYDVCK